MSSFFNYRQMNASELAAKARANAAAAARKGEKWEPIEIEGRPRQICKTWWGQSWCENLERYADYSNRIDRGKRYVKAGSVVDLKIKKGKVLAKVSGSRARPYSVEIHIDPLDEKTLEDLMKTCSAKISSLEELAAGKFPQDLKSLFMEKGVLFPTPRQIHFDCSCPDWAYMCKHVAAVMYGIGVRLDENPFYFFELRGIEADSLIRKTVENKVEAMLAHYDDPSDRIMDLSEASDLFELGDLSDLDDLDGLIQDNIPA